MHFLFVNFRVYSQSQFTVVLPVPLLVQIMKGGVDRVGSFVDLRERSDDVGYDFSRVWVVKIISVSELVDEVGEEFKHFGSRINLSSLFIWFLRR